MHTPLSPRSQAAFQRYESDALSWDFGPLSDRMVQKLTSDWDDLAQNATEKNIFQCPYFIQSSLPLLRDQAPKLVTIWYSGVLIGVVILRADLGYAKLPVPFWRSALHPEQYLGTPLVRDGFQSEFAAGISLWLDQSDAHCGFLQFSKISGDGALADALITHCERTERAWLIANRHSRAAIVPKTHQNIVAEDLLSASRRKSIRRARKRLDDAGKVLIERLSAAEELEDWTEQFFEMENTGWKEEAGSSILSCPHETALYRAAIRSAFESGNLNFSRLCLDGKPIAYTLDILASPMGFCLKSAIDLKYRNFSPGVLMEFETLRFYLEQQSLELLDSCTHPDNAMLNELWPDRREIIDLAIARRGPFYSTIFTMIRRAKGAMQRLADG